MLGVILFGIVVSGFFIVIAARDAVRFCQEKNVVTRVLLSFSGIVAMMMAYIMVGNYIISPLLAQGVINGQLSYRDVADEASVWVNMNIIDELIDKYRMT